MISEEPFRLIALPWVELDTGQLTHRGWKKGKVKNIFRKKGKVKNIFWKKGKVKNIYVEIFWIAQGRGCVNMFLENFMQKRTRPSSISAIARPNLRQNHLFIKFHDRVFYNVHWRRIMTSNYFDWGKEKILKIGRKGCVVLCVRRTEHQPTIITFLFSPYSIKCKRNPSPNFISRGGREQTLTLTTLTQFVSTLTLHWPSLCPKFFFVSAAGSKEKNNSRHISSVVNLETSQLKKLCTEGGQRCRIETIDCE